ncbi:MAG: hypothetical protein ABMB14_33470 [Myxococcota bacterium]
MINTDSQGRVVGFSHHDGELVGVSLENRGTSVKIVLRSSGGDGYVLLLSGVRAFHMDAFREGNIVHAIRVHSVGEARSAFDIPPLVQDRLGLDVTTLPSDAYVFLIEPSYGAAVVAVCRDVDVCAQQP